MAPSTILSLLRRPCVVRRVWWANGATVTGGATIECRRLCRLRLVLPGAKLVSGSAMQGNANEVQFVDVTDTALPTGAVSGSPSHRTAPRTPRSSGRAVTDGSFDAAFRFEESSARPLPATATPAESTDANIWLCGFSTTASP